MTQALNYAAQAQRGLRDFVRNALANNKPVPPPPEIRRDLESISTLADLIGRCVHFQLPEGGNIFDDKLKGIRGQSVSLPFPAISISYRCDYMSDNDGGTYDGSKLLHVPKRLVVAVELSAEEYRKEVRIPGSERICSVTAVFGTNDGQWRPCASYMMIPLDNWDGTGFELPAVDMPTMTKVPSGNDFCGRLGILLPSFFKQVVKAKGAEYAMRSAGHDISGEAAAVLELCEALSCANVGTEVIQKANPLLDARRARDGKLPIWETKVLTIALSQAHAKAQKLGGAHASPRQHLRRGHIRVLPDKRKIWVSSCVVGDPAKGRITTQYHVKA